MSFDQGTSDSPVTGLVLLLLVPKGLLCYQKVLDMLSCIGYEARGDDIWVKLDCGESRLPIEAHNGGVMIVVYRR